MIVQRHTDHLKAGDILPAHGQLPLVVIHRICSNPGMPIGTRIAWITRLDDDVPQQLMAPLAPVTFGPDALVAVEVPDLTPAQARAEDALDLVADLMQHMGKDMHKFNSSLWDRVRLLIDELRPKPPTLEDA